MDTDQCVRPPSLLLVLSAFALTPADRGHPCNPPGYVEQQVHPFDRYFYDRNSHEYTVDRFLDDLANRYGGVDSILVWPTYPMIGADDRNQVFLQ